MLDRIRKLVAGRVQSWSGAGGPGHVLRPTLAGHRLRFAGVAKTPYMLNDVSWHGDLIGSSSSPSIVGFRNDEGHNCALAGMLASGGAQSAQFIRISLITEALKG
ncbi:MAG: hypothetical protein JHC40_10855 [Burkholderiales bacterium]|nr:hypothetical protein [Burkholderiales bacterium]